MLSLDAKEWKEFAGGYRNLYDASIPLKKLKSKEFPCEKIWNELWENLYHQGDVGIASYATVPEIIKIYKEKNWLDYHLPNFAGAVEKARLEEHNPQLPSWLKDEYFESLKHTAQYCLQDFEETRNENFNRSFLLLIAILLKEKDVYELLDNVSTGEESELLKIYLEH